MKRLSKSVSVFFPGMQRLMRERTGMEKRKWKQKKWTIERQILSPMGYFSPSESTSAYEAL